MSYLVFQCHFFCVLKARWWFKSKLTWITLPVCIFRSFYRTRRNFRYEFENAVLQIFWNVHGLRKFYSDSVCCGAKHICHIFGFVFVFVTSWILCSKYSVIVEFQQIFMFTIFLSDVPWSWNCLNLTINASFKEMVWKWTMRYWWTGRFLLEYPRFFFHVYHFVVPFIIFEE